MVQVAFLAALIVVLQILSYIQPIRIGIFNLSFVLVPIVIGAILFGPGVGTFLGIVFGCVVAIACAIGMDSGGVILFAANPFLCILLCLVKGGFAGMFSGWVYAGAAKAISCIRPVRSLREIISAVLAAAVAPLTNTLLFCLGLYVCFADVLYSWAGNTPVFTYVLTGLIGINFIFEFLLNVILCPVIAFALLQTKMFRK